MNEQPLTTPTTIGPLLVFFTTCIWVNTYDPEGSLSEAFRDRVRIHAGDVTREHLGLPPGEYEPLAARVDAADVLRWSQRAIANRAALSRRLDSLSKAIYATDYPMTTCSFTDC